MEKKSTIDMFMAFATIATPIILIIFAGVGWMIKYSFERRADLENKLRDDRIRIYNTILEPFTLLFMPKTAWEANEENIGIDKDAKAVKIVYSMEYRQASLKLSLIADDAVVLAYNEFLQFFYQSEKFNNLPSSERTKKTLHLLGNLLLEIRKSMGNETKIDNWQMLEWFITDIEAVKSGNPSTPQQEGTCRK